MTYRDPLQAAQARIAQLEEELINLRETQESRTRRGGHRLDGEPASPVPAVRKRLDEYKQMLAAAQKQVAELENALASSRMQLEEARKETLGSVHEMHEAEKQALVTQNQALVSQNQALRTHNQLLQNELSAPQSLGSMQTVTEHNRLHPPDPRGDPAGVLCPLCRIAGNRVEMHRIANAAHCPRCYFAQAIA